MAGLTSKDVFAACQALAAEGVPDDKITGHAAWIRLGRGSKSTVQKHWKEWRALQESSSPLTRVAALDAIQQTIDRLINETQTNERARADTTIARLEEDIRHLSRGLASALADAESLAAQLAEATAIKNTEAEARKRAEAERDWLQHQLAERDEELADANAGTRDREREVARAAGRLASKLPRPTS